MNVNEHGHIYMSHVNVRQSISILLAKVIVLDIIAATCIIIFFTALCEFTPFSSYTDRLVSYNTVFFILLGFLKFYFTSYVILLWLNEYYEIMPDMVVHKKGLLWRKEQHYALKYVRTVRLSQSLLGKLFNFGTISLYDIRKNKFLDLYLIHDPHRCLRILEQLIVSPHEEKRIIKGHLFGEDMEDFEQIQE